MTEKKLNKIRSIYPVLMEIIEKAVDLEYQYEEELANVHPFYSKSCRNLLHYMAFRSFDSKVLQEELRNLGFSSLTANEGHVLYSLINITETMESLLGLEHSNNKKIPVSPKKGQKILRKNTKLLFGYKSKKRRTRIMVTLPDEAAEDKLLVKKMLSTGMNCARINCAHNDELVWQQMINNINEASTSVGKKCKIAMDLAGPKLRTGSMKPGPKIMHIKPQRNNYGEVTSPARIWITYDDNLLVTKTEFDGILPLSQSFYKKVKNGDTLLFTDSRGKKSKIHVIKDDYDGKWGISNHTLYLATGTEIRIERTGFPELEMDHVGELLPVEQYITLHKGDTLHLHKDPFPGEDAKRDEKEKIIENAHISCTLAEVFENVKAGENIYLNDGKIEGVIIAANSEELKVRITQARAKGSKLRADKGINLPDSKLPLTGLTEKDKNDLEFVAEHADVINLSFVNGPEDVAEVQDQLKAYDSKAGLIIKIETKEAFKNLPKILLQSMQNYPVGVMIARGDLAVETGWKNFASIQQEIMRMCEAAHIPDILATQVLESLAKKGVPSRAEITDAAMAEQTECVMLNKGPYILKAIRMLDKILKRMHKFQNKNSAVLPKLEEIDKLKLSHKRFDF